MNKLHQLWRLHVTLRTRLALWYLLSLSVILVIYAGFIHTRIEKQLRIQADTGIKLAAERLINNLSISDPATAPTATFTNRNILDDLEGVYTARLVASDGTVWDSLGPPSAPVINGLTEDFSTLDLEDSNKEEEWRIFHQKIMDANGAPIGWLEVLRPIDTLGLLGMARGHAVMGILLGLLLAGLGSAVLAHRALRPIQDITQTAATITAHDLQQRINYVGPEDEVGRLARTFDTMLARLEANFARERRFTGDAAHELRTPLTVLKGQIGVTLSQPRQPQEYQSVLRDLEKQVDRLIQLSTDLLMLARLDHTHRGQTPDNIRMDDLLGALVDQVTPLTAAKRQTLIEDIQPGLVLKGSMDLIIRLCLNLLDNAIKYTPEGGTITLHTHQDDGTLHLDISDTGPGIAAEHLPHLFDRFYRVECDRTRRALRDAGAPGGAGLGLAIVQEIAHAHGGDVVAESTPGQGTTFHVRLPLSPPV